VCASREIAMSFEVFNLRQLKSGGNGDLYIGDRGDNGEPVVVKFLRERHLPHARKAFVREVRVLARGLSGLVPLLAADTEGQRPYYVMPYVKGGPLSQYAGRLMDNQLENVAYELAVVLSRLHANSMVHGDFKPDNVLVCQDGHLKVTDPLGN